MTGSEPEQEVHRGPPPSVGAGWLMVVIMTAFAGAFALELLVLPDHRALRLGLALVPFAFIVWAGAGLWRARGRAAPPAVPWPLLAALAWPAVARPILKLARQEPLTGLDLGLLLFLGAMSLWAVARTRRPVR